jgi:hypothetical protein
MGMIEVASQMKKSVDVYAGSQEVEPGDGWPYDKFLSLWNESAKQNRASAEQVVTFSRKSMLNPTVSSVQSLFLPTKCRPIMIFYPKLRKFAHPSWPNPVLRGK